MARRKTELSMLVAISFLVLLATAAPVLATSTHANSKWDRQEWLMGKFTNTRPELFAQLLEQQNLIGLSRHKVESLLGSPDSDDSYGIFHCCTAGILLRLEYQKNRLKRWRFESSRYNGHVALNPEPWIETNVLISNVDGMLIPLQTISKTKAHLKSKKLPS